MSETDNDQAFDARPVRDGEQLDWPQLAAYVRESLVASGFEGFDPSAKMEVEQFPGGHSNLTYLLCLGAHEFVLRRPPFGPLPPRAHDVARECRMLAALHPAFPLAPRPYLLCEDTSVIGAPFFLMERRRGLVVRAAEPPPLAGNSEARRRASRAVVETLARLHRVDIRESGLATLGKPAGFVTRQVSGWADRWARSQTENLAEMDQVASWLGERLPPDTDHPAIVHGDYKLDNVMLDAADVGQVVGV
ncbi:MAG: phosphotransferase family protein, partial [Pyrinomonadaceae bacterium]